MKLWESVLIGLGIFGLVCLMFIGSMVNVNDIAQGQQNIIDAGLTLKEPLKKQWYPYSRNYIKYNHIVVTYSRFVELAQEYGIIEVRVEWIADGNLKMFWFEIDDPLEGRVMVAYIP